MASWLVRSTSGASSPGSSSGRGHYVVLLGKTLNQVYKWVLANLMPGGGGVILQWTSILPRGE